MARRAHGWVLAAEGLRVEARTVGVEPSAALRGVAGQTVPLGVTRNAALQILAGRLTMVQKKFRLGIVVSGTPQAVPRAETGVEMTVGAELRLVVTVGA